MPDPSFWGGRRVLLTGHTGFKGSWLLLWLLRLGAEVSGYALEPDTEPSLFNQLQAQLGTPGSGGSRFHHTLADLADTTALAAAVERCQPEVVLHLAAQPLVRRGYLDPVGTWATNVMGSLHLLEALRPLAHPCAVVMVTTDKVYQNREWLYGYRETDPLGGHDPYSASKAGAEIAVASWRSSFCGPASGQSSLAIATARAGNVIGGGDWSADRIVPDAIRALTADEPIRVRHPAATRPWQHVLEPLSGYLCLAEAIAAGACPREAFNFGPAADSNRTVGELVEGILRRWPGQWLDASRAGDPHEAGLLHLVSEKARHQLGWTPRWDFDETISRTVDWYRRVERGDSPLHCCVEDIRAYEASV